MENIKIGKESCINKIEKINNIVILNKNIENKIE